MKANPAEVGRIVVSTQGHEKGRWYCVTAILDDRTIACCDGVLRKLDNPKKKQIKHLQALPMTIDMTVKGASGGKFDNSDLRKALEASRKAYETQTGWPYMSAMVDYPESNCNQENQKKEECALVQK